MSSHIEPNSRWSCNIFNKMTEFDTGLNIGLSLQPFHHLFGWFIVHGANLCKPLHDGGYQNLHTDVPKEFRDDW
jgi:hypothetical protein